MTELKSILLTIAINILAILGLVFILTIVIGLSLGNNYGFEFIAGFYYAVICVMFIPFLLLIVAFLYNRRKQTKSSKAILITQVIIVGVLVLLSLPFIISEMTYSSTQPPLKTEPMQAVEQTD